MKRGLFLSLLMALLFWFPRVQAQTPSGFVPVKAKKITSVAIDLGKQITLPQPVREWTVMVFFNGKNDLASDLRFNAKSLEKAIPGESVNVVLELGMTNTEELSAKGFRAWRGVRRFFIIPDTEHRELVSVPLPGQAFGDMGSYRHLIRFAAWTKQNFPAKKYMLLIGSHGQGIYGISNDTVTKNQISAANLGKALAKIGGVDVYASDACLMQMAEVAYFLKDSARVVVGSEEIMPYRGFDYTAIVNSLRHNPEMEADAAGIMMVETFNTSYIGSGKHITLSALRMNGMPELAASLQEWTAAVERAPDAKRSLRAALPVVRQFMKPEFRDLHHFMELVSRNTTDERLKRACNRVLLVLDEQLLLLNKQRRYKQANGLAIYIPTENAIWPDYQAMPFATASGWYDFLKWLTANHLLDFPVANIEKADTFPKSTITH